MIIFEPHTSRYDDEFDFKTLINLFKHNYSTAMVSSNSQKGSEIVENLGYKSFYKIINDDVERRIYKNITNDDIINLLTKTGGLRTVVFVPDNTYNLDL